MFYQSETDKRDRVMCQIGQGDKALEFVLATLVGLSNLSEMIRK